MNDNEDTERVWPPADSVVFEREAPVPMVVISREEFRLELTRALERAAPEPSPASVARKVRHSALVGGKYAGVVLLALGLLQGVVSLWRPDLAGPLGDLIRLLGGGP